MRSRKRKESHWHDGQPSGYDWIARTTRVAIYLRDEWKCLACGYTASPDAPGDGAHPWAGLTLDHLRRDVPAAEVHKPTNLVTLCLSCNSSRRHTNAKEWNPVFAEVAYFHVQVLGARVGYWPCLRAPFVQLALGRHLFDVWYGDPSYLARRS